MGYFSHNSQPISRIEEQKFDESPEDESDDSDEQHEMDDLEIPDEDKEAIYAPQLLIEYEKKPSFS